MPLLLFTPVLATFLFIALINDAWARDLFLDAGSLSDATPLQTLIESGTLTSGDRIRLRSGNYGELTISGKVNSGWIEITAAPGHTPKLAGITISGSAFWRLRGLHVDNVRAYGEVSSGSHVKITDGSSDIELENLVIGPDADPTGWSAEVWRVTARDGITAFGQRLIIRDNRLRTVRHGIHIDADQTLVEDNSIQHFAGDGIRGLGDYTVYRGNRISDCYSVDGNHDDGFQSWSLNTRGQSGRGQVVGVTVEGNMILNLDTGHPLNCMLQGIGLFDGLYVDWTIQNNIVMVKHLHGITVMGARNVKVRNNAVLASSLSDGHLPWISITAHKDGRPAQDSIVANNLVASMPRKARDSFGYDFSLPQPGVRVANNALIRYPARYFADIARGDFGPRAKNLAIDRGDPDLAPKSDLKGTPRPQGAAVDLGPYEQR